MSSNWERWKKKKRIFWKFVSFSFFHFLDLTEDYCPGIYLDHNNMEPPQWPGTCFNLVKQRSHDSTNNLMVHCSVHKYLKQPNTNSFKLFRLSSRCLRNVAVPGTHGFFCKEYRRRLTGEDIQKQIMYIITFAHIRRSEWTHISTDGRVLCVSEIQRGNPCLSFEVPSSPSMSPGWR